MFNTLAYTNMFFFSYDLLMPLVGISTILYVYNHRYDCIHQLCVWYVTCTRKYRKKETQNIKQWILSYIHDASVKDNSAPCHSNATVHIKLFPYIKSITAADANDDEVAPSETLLKGIRSWTLVCEPDDKDVLNREVCLYDELKTHCNNEKCMPQSITITLDKALIDLLNIPVPVHTNDGTYILNKDTSHKISF